METFCKTCESPIFMCECKKFELSDCNGTTDSLNGVVYTSISISTMTVCFNFNKFIDLNKLKENLPEKLKVNYFPQSKKSKIKKKKGTDSFYNSFDIKLTFLDRESGIFSNVSIFIFPNGKVKMAGIKTYNTIDIVIEEIIDIFNYVPECLDNISEIEPENVKIQMICSDFKIKPIKEDSDGWCLKQEELKNILVKKGYSATFSALSKYPGINLKIPSLTEEDKKVSLLIFRSGSIIITGAKNMKDISTSYIFIIDIISKNANNLFYYDINEEIKQKKKKKSIKTF